MTKTEAKGNKWIVFPVAQKLQKNPKIWHGFLSSFHVQDWAQIQILIHKIICNSNDFSNQNTQTENYQHRAPRSVSLINKRSKMARLTQILYLENSIGMLNYFSN